MSWPDVVALLSVLATLIVALLAFFRGRRTDSAAAAGSLEAKVDRLDHRYRALEDYAYSLRRTIADAGMDVPPWPDELKDGHGD